MFYKSKLANFLRPLNASIRIQQMLFFSCLFLRICTKSAKIGSVICHIQFQWNITKHFRNRISKIHVCIGVTVEKLLSEEQYVGNKKFEEIFLLLTFQTSYCLHLEENGQIPFDLSLSKETQQMICTLTFRDCEKFHTYM